jgi:hypothetical protein
MAILLAFVDLELILLEHTPTLCQILVHGFGHSLITDFSIVITDVVTGVIQLNTPWSLAPDQSP